MSSNYIRVMDFGSLRDFILPKSRWGQPKCDH